MSDDNDRDMLQGIVLDALNAARDFVQLYRLKEDNGESWETPGAADRRADQLAVALDKIALVGEAATKEDNERKNRE